MSFNIQPLPESIDFSDAETSPYITIGKGQTVYWRNCTVKVYEKGQSKPKEQYKTCDGCAIVLGDIEVTFSGQGGIILEK
ncbi:hypothetical protein J3F84DRAFT_376191 [Trichoderma pleuroticola]